VWDKRIPTERQPFKEKARNYEQSEETQKRKRTIINRTSVRQLIASMKESRESRPTWSIRLVMMWKGNKTILIINRCEPKMEKCGEGDIRERNELSIYGSKRIRRIVSLSLSIPPLHQTLLFAFAPKNSMFTVLYPYPLSMWTRYAMCPRIDTATHFIAGFPQNMLCLKLSRTSSGFLGW